MKSNQKKSGRLTDFLLASTLILSILVLMYLMPKESFNPFNIILLILVLIPTIMALVNGAPFVPTPMMRVEKMLELAKIKKGEKVYDIGCGDGRMVYLAAKIYGAEAIGLELSPLVFLMAKIRQFFWKSKAKILFRNFHVHSLKDADVIMCYILPDTLARLQTKLDKELKKGARVVSYAFQIGNWKETHKEEKDPVNNLAPIWVYER